MAEHRPPDIAPHDIAPDVLSVSGLCISYRTPQGSAQLVRDVAFDLRPGEIVSLVGESGSGKTLTGRAILGLLRQNDRMAVSGSVELSGRELTRLSGRELRRVHGQQISMIFQDPVGALDPVIRIGRQVAEALTRASVRRGPRQLIARQVAELLSLVGITDPELRMRQFPHEISGGMCQRVLIAIALAGNPRLLVADEPTTALDVTIQAQVLDLLTDLSRERGLAVLLVTHDMGVAARTADRVLVMYAGTIVEQAPTTDFFAQPAHPYSLGLIRAVPRIDVSRSGRLSAIPGAVPEARSRPPGCPFHPRCPAAVDLCRRREPALQRAGSRLVACHRADEMLSGELALWADTAIVSDAGVPVAVPAAAGRREQP